MAGGYLGDIRVFDGDRDDPIIGKYYMDALAATTLVPSQSAIAKVLFGDRPTRLGRFVWSHFD
jgi:hypothetical protein